MGIAILAHCMFLFSPCDVNPHTKCFVDIAPAKKPLDWSTRMKIASGAAKGLEYLHDKADPPVIYRDTKAQIFYSMNNSIQNFPILGLLRLEQVVTRRLCS